MADTDIIVSEMPSASQINTNDLIMLTQPDVQAETGYSTKKGTTLQIFNKALKGTEYSTDLPSFENKNVLEGMEELKANIEALLPVDTASGNIASFNTELARPLQSVIVNVVATGGNGTPDNPIPINGYTEANITRCGVNLWDEVWEVGSINNSTGLDENDPTNIRGKNYIIVKPSTAYYFYIGVSKNLRIYWYDVNKSFISSETVEKAVKTAPLNACYLRVRTTTSYGDTYNNDISINYPSSDTSYHPYNGNTYTIAFGQTVYGGVLDVTRGKLTVTHGYADLGDFTYTYYAQYLLFTTDLTDGVKSENTNVNVLCDDYKGVIGYGTNGINNTSLNDVICVGSNYVAPNANLLIRNTDYTDENAFKTAVTGIKFAYVLATPFDIDLTPEVISAIVGTNNVFADCGNIEVKFKDTIQHYIDKKIAQTQALIL